MDLPTYQHKPTKSYTLGSFARQCEDLFLKNPREFQTFSACGDARSLPEQVYIDIQPNMLTRDQGLIVKRDIDSLLAITKTLVPQTPLCIYPVPNPADNLVTSIHLSWDMVKPDNTIVAVPYHYVPNFLFAFWGSRSQIHIIFPALYDFTGAKCPSVTDEQKAEFYDMGIRPAIEELMPENASDWPPNYSSEVFRARQSTGRMAYGTKMMGPEFLEEFVRLLREKLELNQVLWAAEFRFIHTVRGVKLGNLHSPDAESAAIAQREFFAQNCIPIEATQSGRWYIDIGMEFQSPDGQCLQWTSHSHASIIRAFLEVSEDQAIRMTALGSSRYSRDMVSHLTAIAGCRVEPRSTKGPHEVVYVQMYSTDKAVTYNPERGHHGKAIEMKEAMGPQPSEFVSGLFDTYDAAGTIVSHARIELRVPLRHSLSVLFNIPRSTIRRSLAAFDPETWWTFRRYRLLAMSQILTAQAEEDPEFRVRGEALLLTAAVVWLINGLHSRPDDGSAARDLMRCVLPVTDDHVDQSMLMFKKHEHREVNGDALPFNPYGCVFLRPIMVHFSVGAPRFRSSGRFLQDEYFMFWFKMDIQQVRLRYHTKLIARDPQHGTNHNSEPHRVNNKTRLTATRTNHAGETETPLFALEAQGYTNAPLRPDEGSDVEEGREEDVQMAPNGPSIDEELSEIWRQLPPDILNKSPNRSRHTDDKYTHLSKADRDGAGEDVLQNNCLSDIWEEVYFKVGKSSEFDTAFANMFPNPRKTTRPAHTQNYFQSKYYLDWVAFCAGKDEVTIEASRGELKKRFDALMWVPTAQADRMWVSSGPKKTQQDTFTRLPLGSKGPAPRVLIRERPVWCVDEQ
ncbi:hypothetical protein V5O48_006650 [Marasmius crinis-equi]|uniref:Uncharacterized protein n=1 Tax=Marasmius crinis-equi TaxID=585013 RepID=A0ABR3FIZ5_9AGAR